MTRHYSVGLIGFNVVETEKIKKILDITQSKPRSYCFELLNAEGGLDIVLVNNDDENSLTVLIDFQNHQPNTQVVTFSKRQDAGDLKGVQHIKGMLLATKVIKALDLLSVPEKNTISSEAEVEQEPLVNNAPESHVIKVVSAVSSHCSDDLPSNRFNVLVVDDSEVMQKSLAIELERAPEKTSVDFAGSGEMALELINQNHYDFIFLDVMMPGIDGYETCTEIRKMNGMKTTPIIMLSAKTSPLDEVKGVMAGCSSYLTKPIQSDEFQKVLARVMKFLQKFKQKKILKGA